MSEVKTLNLVVEPFYHHRDYESNLKDLNPTGNDRIETIKMIVQVSLPLITLYKPFRRPVALIFGASKTASSLFMLKNAYEIRDNRLIFSTLFQTAMHTANFACTIFAAPIGSLISTTQDLMLHATQLAEALKKGEYKKALLINAEIVNDALYLSLFFTGAAEIAIASLSIQLLLEVIHIVSVDGKVVTAADLLNSLVHLILAKARFGELVNEIHMYQFKLTIDKHIAEIKKRLGDNFNLEKNDQPVEARKAHQLQDMTEAEILRRAKEYLKNPEVEKKQAPELDLTKSLGYNPNEKQIIDALLKDHPGFCLGENHTHESPLEFLISNMENIKNNNIKVLFVEGVEYQLQPIIDRYFSSQDRRELDSNDRRKISDLFHEFSYFTKKNNANSPYTNAVLMEMAKRNGIHYVGIDYRHEETGSYNYTKRLEKMNFIASQVIENYKKTLNVDEKFVAYMGADHLRKPSREEPIKGVADLTETPAIFVRDAYTMKTPFLYYSELQYGKKESLKVNHYYRNYVGKDA